MIDHTLSWELARVGGMVAYVLVTASVVIGMLVSLKLRSPRWPRWVTTELHRFVTLLALVAVVHGVAVWIDPFTGFTPAEVLVPLASHYRPLWLAAGIVAGYLLLGVWASEYARAPDRICLVAQAALPLLRGFRSGHAPRGRLGQRYGRWMGSAGVRDSRRIGPHPLDLATLAGGGSPARTVRALGVLAAAVWLGIFTVSGPAQSGWNAIANNGAGSGASAAWLVSHPSSPTAPTTSFTANLVGELGGESGWWAE